MLSEASKPHSSRGIYNFLAISASSIAVIVLLKLISQESGVKCMFQTTTSSVQTPAVAPQNLQAADSPLSTSQVSLPIPEPCFKGQTPFGLDLVKQWWSALQELYEYAPPLIFPQGHMRRLNLTGLEMDFILSSYSNFYSGYSEVGDARYVRIWKNGNNAIRCNMENCFDIDSQQLIIRKDLDDRASNSFTFTFVRDPVTRWASGYNEIEYRIKNIDVGNICSRCTFQNFPVGSAERVWAFLHDLLAMNMLKCLQNHCSIVLPHIQHVFPQSGVLRHLIRLDYINLTEHIAVEWPRLQGHIKIGEHPKFCEFNKTLCEHPSSLDPHKTYAAAKSAIRNFPALEAILQRILVDDYRCFFGLIDKL